MNMTEQNCENISNLLVDYADGELSSGEEAGVAAHLSACSACRRQLHALSASLELARTEWQAIPVSSRKMAAQVRQHQVAQAGLRGLAASLLVAACGAAWWMLQAETRSFVVVAPFEQPVPSAADWEAIE